jgi:DNA-binding HxlR family transcriptional regulator
METDVAKRAKTVSGTLQTDCPLTAALDAIGGKWSLIILYWLEDDKKRFNELRRLMPAVSHKVLAATLRRLEREGIITRTVYPEVPPKVEYSISSYGRSVCPVIDAVRRWGRQHLEQSKYRKSTTRERPPKVAI